MQHPFKYPSRMALLLLLVVAAGCAEKTATVSGVVFLDGEPLVIAQGMRGTVVFQPASRQGPTLNGVINATGHYELTAGSKKLVSPGVYMAAVSAVEIIPASDENTRTEGRLTTPAKYASVADSGLRFVVQPGPNLIELKLSSEPAADKAPPESSPEESRKTESPPSKDANSVP